MGRKLKACHSIAVGARYATPTWRTADAALGCCLACRRGELRRPNAPGRILPSSSDHLVVRHRQPSSAKDALVNASYAPLTKLHFTAASLPLPRFVGQSERNALPRIWNQVAALLCDPAGPARTGCAGRVAVKAALPVFRVEQCDEVAMLERI